MSDTYPEYTTKLEAENKRLQEENKDLIAVCTKVSTWLINLASNCHENAKSTKGRFDSLSNAYQADEKNYIDIADNIKRVIAKHTPEAQGSRKELI